MNALYIAETPYFYCGLIVEGETVQRAAPIMRWAVGKDIKSVEAWLKSKGGSLFPTRGKR